MSSSPQQPILTLEPLVEAVREGVQRVGWELSGLQKTTSHQFEGRWAGDSTRSAYLFFHDPHGPDWASVDVYLDETSRGLTGNLALVIDTRRLSEIGEVPGALAVLGGLAAAHLPRGYGTPITFRVRLEEATSDPESASTEVRFKLRIPRAALNAGPEAISALASETVRAFAGLLSAPELRPFLDPE